MDLEEMMSRGFTGAPVSKIGPSGKELLGSIRAYPKGVSEESLVAQVGRMYERRELHEVRAALDRPSPDAGRERVRALYDQLSQSCGFSNNQPGTEGYWMPTPSLREPGSEHNLVAHLLGAVVRLGKTWAEVDEAALQRAVDESAARLTHALDGQHGWKVYFPGGSHRLTGAVFPEQMRMHAMHALLWRLKTGAWNERLAIFGPGGRFDQLAAQMEAVGVRFDNAGQHTDAMFVLVGIAHQAAPVAKDLLAQTAPWRSDVALALVGETAAEAPTGADDEPKIVAVDTLCEAQALHELLHRRDNLMQVAHLARERAEEESLTVVSGWVSHESDDRLIEELRIGLWKECGAFAYGTTWMFEKGRPKSPSEDLLSYVCKELGIEHKRLPGQHVDALGGPKGDLNPGPDGRWLDAERAVAGAGADLIKSVNWRDYDEFVGGAGGTGKDGSPGESVGGSFPAPLAAINMGLVDVVQEHYSPKMYAALKELLSDVKLSDEGVMRRLEERFPSSFRELMRHTPTAALPVPAEMMTLRLHWSRSPTIVVKKTLSQRMVMTDIGLDIEAGLIPTPFPLQYLHFESPREDLTWALDEGASDEVRLSGLFVHDHPGDEDSGNVWRVIDIGILGIDARSSKIGFADVRLTFESASSTLADALLLWRQEDPDDQPSAEWVTVIESACREIAKILIYIGSPDARRIEMNERSKLLASLKGKSEGQKLKAREQLKRVYDYIMVGPIEAFEESVTTAGGRKMIPHHRRGGLRAVACGTGKTQRRLKLYPPLIVNKHLLGADPSTWPRPKNYRVK
jgi:hypothetical protein